MSNSVSKTVLITGASGQLGRRLIPRLINAGFKVRAHYRSQEKAQKHCPSEAVTVFGDLLEPGWLDDAVRGCDIVIHCAAIVSLRPRPNTLMKKVNIEGTRAVIASCRNNAVKRLIHVSSIITVGGSEDGQPLDETAPYNLGVYKIPYFDTKVEAERIALEASDAGLDVVVVNPSIMISPPDRELTAKDLKKIPKWVPVYFDFGMNIVETDDVITGIISAIDKGRPGERYLLTGENLYPKKAFEFGAEFLGIKKPIVKIPIWTLYPVAAVMEIIARLRNKRPKFHRGLARIARHKFVYSYEKACKELGYSPAPLRKSLERILPSIKR